MTNPSGPGPYRVRRALAHERTVPGECPAPRFHCRLDAERWACRQPDGPGPAMVLEKLAPNGCWLQLSMLQGNGPQAAGC